MPRKQKPIIVHLQVRSRDIQTNFPEYNPTLVDPTPVQAVHTIQYDSYEPPTNKPIQTGANSHVIECNTEYKDSKIYPRSSKTVCWWDGHCFDTKPFFIPKAIIENQSKQEHSYSVYGNFCSPECALAYLESESSVDPEVRWERTMLLHEMCKRVYTNKTERISPSLPRWVLNSYGGGLAIEDYRKLNTKPCGECEIVYPPITVDIPILRVHNADKKPTITKKVIIQEERFQRAEKNLIKNIKPEPEKKGILDLMNIRVENMT